MKRIRLGPFLAIGFSGTLLSLFINKQVHKTFGTLFSIFAIYHMFQHNRQIIQFKNRSKGNSSMNLLKMVGIPTSKIELILKAVDKANYIPGRIRIYSKHLKNNPKLQIEVEKALSKYRELSSFKINPISGSLLIEYKPEAILNNKELVDIENYVKNLAKNK